METSIIIRVKNERESLKKLFAILKNQTYQKFEVIIVDNTSTDGSDKIALDYFPKDQVRIVEISNFSYPKACNLGAENAKGKFLVYLSAHSFPVSNTWLADGLSNFINEKVAGVFAYPIPGKDSTIAEKISGITNKKKKEGHLGNTNSIIRKDLWEEHKFDEGLIGSEDYEWSLYWEKKGFKVINDPKLHVYHSHHLGFLGIIKRQLMWKKQKGEINTRY